MPARRISALCGKQDIQRGLTSRHRKARVTSASDAGHRANIRFETFHGGQFPPSVDDLRTGTNFRATIDPPTERPAHLHPAPPFLIRFLSVIEAPPKGSMLALRTMKHLPQDAFQITHSLRKRHDYLQASESFLWQLHISAPSVESWHRAFRHSIRRQPRCVENLCTTILSAKTTYLRSATRDTLHGLRFRISLLNFWLRDHSIRIVCTVGNGVCLLLYQGKTADPYRY